MGILAPKQSGSTMTDHFDIPETLGLLAGKGSYPLMLAESARQQGVKRVCAFGFRGESNRALEAVVDSMTWIRFGEAQKLVDAMHAQDVKHAVMAGQITPTILFRMRLDARAREVLRRIKRRNADTLYGAVADELDAEGIAMLPASSFMETHLARPGLLTQRAPAPEEEEDIAFGFEIAKATSGLDIGQTVVVKEGTVLAVEAFEGTDRTIRRCRRFGHTGAVVVKVAKQGHDMRFDIPAIGRRTIKSMRRGRASCLALETGRAIILARDEVIAQANEHGIAIVVK